MKQRKHLASLIGICGVLSVLGGCKQDTEITQPTTTIEVTEPTIQIDETTTMEETNVQTQQLVINPGCIGCGHCVVFAPNNFAMNGRQAEIISQDNLDTPQIQQAIRSCKTRVIEIIEV